MADGKIKALADAVNLQVAAEAFWGRSNLSAGLILATGNKNNSKSPNNIISDFVDGAQPARFTAVAHIDLSSNATTVQELGTAAVSGKSGLSATLFYDSEADRYTLSVRSTEHAESIYDPLDHIANKPDIFSSGWAFGQVKSLESFWSGLVGGQEAFGEGDAVTVRDSTRLDAFRVAMANGITQVDVTGYSLGANIATAFTELHRTDVRNTYLFNGAGTGSAKQGTFSSVWQKFIQEFDAPSDPKDLILPEAQKADLISAFKAFSADPSKKYPDIYQNPRYKLALASIQKLVNGSFSDSKLFGKTASAPRVEGGVGSPIFDVIALDTDKDGITESGVARSGIRHGQLTAVWYEDQPATSPDDWGSGHSIAPLQDSLNLMALFETIDPRVQMAELGRFFESSSNQKFNSLEQTVDALGRFFGFGVDIAEAESDTQFADIGLRNALHDRIKDIKNSATFKAIEGKVRFASSNRDLATASRTDFGAMVALLERTPFWFAASSGSDAVAVENALKSAHSIEYAAWSNDKSLTKLDIENGLQRFTDEWRTDRAAFVQALVERNANNGALETLIRIPGTLSGEYEDRASGAKISINIAASNSGEPADVSKFIFGDDTGGPINGASKDDHLYGGASADTINGDGGRDRLEGNAGNDVLDGGQGEDTLFGGDGNDELKGGDGGFADYLVGAKGNDTLNGGRGGDLLVGGEGDDTYKFDSNWGSDVIQDSSGANVLIVAGFENGLPIGKKIEEEVNVYMSEDRKVIYKIEQKDDKYTLSISFTESKGNQIRIEGWSRSSNNFGIQLDDNIEQATTDQSVFGDGAPRANPFFSDPFTSTYGYIPGGVGSTDVINGSHGSESIFGGTGNDALFSSDGKDFIDGGDGDDVILGGDDSTQIKGGIGNDFILGTFWQILPTWLAPVFNDLPAGAVVKSQGYGWRVYEAPDPNGPEWSNGTLLQLDFARPASQGDDLAAGSSNTLNGSLGAASSPLTRLRLDSQARGAQAVGDEDSEDNFIDAGDGDDFVAAGIGSDVVSGGDGNDSIYGMNGDDAIDGNEGNDSITGDGPGDADSYVNSTDLEFPGDDTLDGGAGNDTISGDTGSDVLIGGSGNDKLYGDNQFASWAPVELHGKDVLDGGDGNDTLVGEGQDDQLFGGSGDDRIWGDDSSTDKLAGDFHGKDVVYAGTGDDYVEGGGGADRIAGGEGNDSLWGDADSSAVAGQFHDADFVDGGDGNDAIVGGGGGDTLLGGAGNDSIFGDANLGESMAENFQSADFINGQDGDDIASAGGGEDTVLGGAGNDFLQGEAGNDAIDGGSGNDILDGGTGDDTLVGGGGTDVTRGGEGNDVYVFAAGDLPLAADGAEGIEDTSGMNRIVISGASLSALQVVGYADGALGIGLSASEALVLAAGTAETISAFEINGTTFSTADLIGRFSDDQVSMTRDGRTHVYGGRGDDTITSSSSNSRVSGGRGNDNVVLSARGFTYGYARGDGWDRLNASSAQRGLQGNVTSDPVLGTVEFGEGISATDIKLSNKLGLTISLDDLGSGFTIEGFNSNDALTATGVDLYRFSDGTTLTHAELLERGFDLIGTDASDQIQGTNVSDRIDGGAGNDSLNGGLGSDTYRWGVGSEQDLIVESANDSGSIDKVLLSDGINAQDLKFMRINDDLFIKIVGRSDSLRINGHFAGQGIEHLVFVDGTDWDAVAIANAATIGYDTSNGADSVDGGVYADLIEGLGGDDTLNGLGQRDTLLGGEGQDALNGGDDSDVLSGGSGNDTLVGDSGDDTLAGGVGNDLLDGGSGHNTFVFELGDGQDTVSGLYGWGGTLSLGQGINSADVKVRRSGTSSTDLKLTFANAGDVVTLANAFLPSGEYSPNPQVNAVQFADGTSWTYGELMLRTMTGDGAADSLVGTVYDDAMDGGGGADTISANSGNDTLTGGQGDDVLYGGAGDDVYVFRVGDGADTVIDTGSGVNVLKFGPGVSKSSLRFEDSNRDLKIVIGTNGDSVALPNFYNNVSGAPDQSYSGLRTLQFDDGTTWDFAQWGYSVMRGSYTWDDVTLSDSGNVYGGWTGDDTIRGQGGDDWLNGDLGNDSLTGGTGNDTLLGGAGNDTLSAGTGVDVLNGGAGNDQFQNLDAGDTVLFGRGDGQDTLSTNGQNWGSILQFKAGLAPADIKIVNEAGSLALEVSGGTDRILLASFFRNWSTSSPIVADSQVFAKFADGTVWTISQVRAMYVSAATEANDSLRGTYADDAMNGLGGNDTIDGESGNDTLLGGAGDDVLTVALSTNALLNGGEGNDSLRGNGVLLGGVGDDYLEGGGLLDGGDGSDTLEAGSGSDTLVGGIGNDTLRSGGGTDLIQFGIGDGQDVVLADSGYQPTLDTLAFGPGIAPESVVVALSGADLVLSIAGTTDSITFQGFMTQFNGFYDGRSPVDVVTFANGTQWDLQTLVAKIPPQVISGTSGNDNLQGTSQADELKGLAGNDTLLGGAGNDILEGGAGNDSMSGQGGNDIYRFDRGDGADTLTSGVDDGSVDELRFGANVLPGDVIVTRSGDDMRLAINGTSDSILVKGFAFPNTPLATVSFANGTVWTSQDLKAQLALIQGTTGADSLTGASYNDSLVGLGGNDTLTGLSGYDTLDGGAGVDRLVGGQEDDLYIVDSTSDVVVENDGEGSDTVRSSATYTLPNYVEFLELTGTAAINGTGNSQDNVIYGNSGNNSLSGGAGYDDLQGGAGNDTLNGGTGEDFLSGGTGDDSYVVDVPVTFDEWGSPVGDVVAEAADEGIDSVSSSVSYTLLDNVENLTLTGSSGLTGTGNALANNLTGNSGANRLTGGDGNDTLNGGTGTDTMVGGTGDDSYFVDATADVITEASGEGLDSVSSTATYTLSNNVENLTLTGSTAINGTGNALANQLTGNSGANKLTGGDGNDTLNGGAGTDTLVGGIGNDVYYVDATTDVVTELTGEGTDTVMTSVTLTAALANFVENLTITGTSNLNAVGNTLDNVMTGNTGNNSLTGGDGNDTLDGAGGVDTLIGGLGNDIFIVDSTTDVVTEASGAGTDTIMTSVTLSSLAANVENLTLTGTANLTATGSAVANVLTGNAGNNLISGLAGADTLDGGAGNDTLNGGADADTYLFGLGYGADVIIDSDSTAGVKDVVRFGAGLTQNDIRFTQSGNALVATIKSTAESLTIQDWYLSANNRVEEFRFNDGTVLTNVQAQALVGAMAAFNPSGAGIASVQDPSHRARTADIAVSGMI